MQKSTKRKFHGRTLVQGLFFAFIAFLAVGKWLTEIGVMPAAAEEASLHALCPFGGVVTVYQFFATGDFLPKLHSAAFILMLLGLAVALLFGPLFCGYVCPMGSVQEWVGKLGRRLFQARYNRLIPPRADKILGYLRYGVLAMELLNARSDLLSTTQLLDQVALDRYSFVRDAYLSRRLDQVWDGAPPLEDYDDYGDEEAEPAR